MQGRGHVTFTYVDDIICISDRRNHAQKGFKYLQDLLADLNFPKKLVALTTVTNCLGVIVNTVEQMVSVPTDKQTEILEKCRAIIDKKR